MLLLRRVVMRLLLCLAVAAGPFGHGMMAAQATPAPATAITQTHCHDDMAGSASDADESGHAGMMKAAGCATLCCALLAAFGGPASVATRARDEAPHWSPGGRKGGALRPPLPPPRG